MSNTPVNPLTEAARLSTNVSLQAANRSSLEQSTSTRSNQVASTSYNYTGREREANNTLAEALRNNHIGDFTNNGSASYSGSVSSADPTDFYAFTVNHSKSTVNLYLSGMNANANLFLYNDRGQEISSSMKPGTEVDHIRAAGLDAGTYYVAVHRPSANTVNTINYSLGVSAVQSRKQLVFEVTNLKDTGGLDGGSPPDWYAKVNIDGNRFQTSPIRWPSWGVGYITPVEHNPNWVFTKDIPLSGGNPVNISLEVWDRDLLSRDDQADINSGSAKSLDFRIDLASGRITSNDLRIPSFNVGETKTTEGEGRDRNRITFKFSTRYI